VAAIGDAWAADAWVEAGWITGAWLVVSGKTGTVASTESADTCVAEGTIYSNITGTVAASGAADTCVAVGDRDVTGVITSSGVADRCVATGTIPGGSYNPFQTVGFYYAAMTAARLETTGLVAAELKEAATTTTKPIS